jgi:hypothetical protein
MIKRLALAVIAAAAIGLGTVACTPPATATVAPPAATSTQPATVWPAGFVLPDHRLTPGASGHDIAQICRRVSRVLEDGRPSAAVKVTINVTGSFKGFADPGANGTTDQTQGYGQPLTSNGPVKGTITYDVKSSTPPDPANLLPNQAPDTGLGTALSQLFDNQPASTLIVGGGDVYTFSYQNGNYVQDTTGIHGDVTGH